MALWLLFPFILQAIVIGIDEGYFHIKRGLPRWERIGHPIDTFSILACLAFVLFVPYTAAALKVFIGLALFSCLLVTKDEFVHKHHCPASEQWLHALLFLNHPILLTSLGLLWPHLYGVQGLSFLSYWLSHYDFLRNFLLFQMSLTALFMLYQIVYWNFIWKTEEVK